ncbi:lysoplasmalogenase [Paenibacillus sp. L3-i20]|uniref:lysoplasmalogenase n=1 Tax=Paenibacillus sp. L3-i20 TaxID=2905833 RepID=UPI001EE06E41|nr:lysoplasmalogenase [Paenibacillus sp. L3-i20]GKU77468.1 membrane protein [Paenibacillus sp. L3-i20]
MSKWLIALIIVTGSVHLATLSLDSELLHWIFKLVPMILIIVLAVSTPKSEAPITYKGLIVTGLVFSIGGDTFLLMPDDEWFTFGLASFLIGHVFYTIAMLKHMKASWLTRLSVIPIVTYSFVLGSQLHGYIIEDSNNSGLWIPVLVYIIVIAAMCWTAIMSGNVLAGIGAALFVVSDSILAWNKFATPVANSGIWIMATYFSAQLLIAASIAGFSFHIRQVSGNVGKARTM